jgi:hypothetical protein
MTVLAVLAILASSTILSLSKMKSTLARRSMSVDLYSELAMARARARMKERTQIVVVDAAPGSNGTFGYYHFEDSATPPAIFSGSQLSSLVGAMTNPPAVPAGYTLTLLESRTSATNGFSLSADAWAGTALPFPWAGLMTSGKISTASGCSFCSSGQGAVAFLPSGTAIFSDSNALGGFIVVAGDSASPGTGMTTGIGISPTGFVEQVERL